MLEARAIVFSQIITTAKPAQTEPQKKKTPWWVIFLSVLGGVLLLGGAAAVLWKVRLSLLTTKSTYSVFVFFLLSCCYTAYFCSRKKPALWLANTRALFSRYTQRPTGLQIQITKPNDKQLVNLKSRGHLPCWPRCRLVNTTRSRFEFFPQKPHSRLIRYYCSCH